MTSFLFWNVMKKDLRPVIARAVIDRDVAVLLLAESEVADEEVVGTLKQETGRDYVALAAEDDKVRVFSRIASVHWTRRQSDPIGARMAVWSVEVGKPPGILIAIAHLVSKHNATSEEQSLFAQELATEIRRVEDAVGHERTVVVGDLNMNPFETGVTGALTLHAVMTKKIAEKRTRTVQNKLYRFFYNPMWGLFGDRTTGPPATYYHRAPAAAEQFWHMFDQVLLRPDLMNLLGDLVIVDQIGGTNLLTSLAGVPNHQVLSDHLPIAFTLNLD